MNKRNPQSPWNPGEPVAITPKQYEEHVVEWLRSSVQSLGHFNIQHLRHFAGSGGDYEFDAVAEFNLFHGARILVIVECKRYSRPVEREEILALWAKLQDVGAHKAIIFATCGFQLGALEFASSRGIATITFVEGKFLYETRATGSTPEPPPWANLPLFAGIVLTSDGTSIRSSSIDHNHLTPLRDWLEKIDPDI